MPRYRTAYPPEFRRQMVDLVRSGRTPEELAREFEPTAQSISTLVKQAERDAGKRSVGDAYDNAMCESFFATLECELIDRRRFRSHSEARMAVFQFIEGFYNPSRRHSALGDLSPIEYERKHNGLSNPA